MSRKVYVFINTKHIKNPLKKLLLVLERILDILEEKLKLRYLSIHEVYSYNL